MPIDADDTSNDVWQICEEFWRKNDIHPAGLKNYGGAASGKNSVIAEAQLAADAKIPIVTIALGAYADTALMQQVADMTGGAAFVVPGGQPIAEVKTQLEEVFGKAAADRPLQMVQ
jgi:hypothetical protein